MGAQESKSFYASRNQTIEEKFCWGHCDKRKVAAYVVKDCVDLTLSATNSNCEQIYRNCICQTVNIKNGVMALRLV
jgi:hypothetical protein